MPQIFNQSVYTIFGGLKAKWPALKTMAVLDWQTFPSDLPLDIWVDEYADYGKSESYDKPTPKETLRQNWLASKSNHQFWWCECTSSFWPACRGRSKEALAAQTGASGPRIRRR